MDAILKGTLSNQLIEMNARKKLKISVFELFWFEKLNFVLDFNGITGKSTSQVLRTLPV